jgi:hypothetical protein
VTELRVAPIAENPHNPIAIHITLRRAFVGNRPNKSPEAERKLNVDSKSIGMDRNAGMKPQTPIKKKNQPNNLATCLKAIYSLHFSKKDLRKSL